MRIIILLLIAAGVAGYFTRPDEPTLSARADAVLRDVNSLEDLGDAARAIVGDRQFSDYYVVTRYTISQGDKVLVNCWGAFTQAQCTRTES